MVSKCNKRGTNKEKVWKHGAILEGNKGTRTPPTGDRQSSKNQ